jgi:hypothetical protein
MPQLRLLRLEKALTSFTALSVIKTQLHERATDHRRWASGIQFESSRDIRLLELLKPLELMDIGESSRVRPLAGSTRVYTDGCGIGIAE